MVFIEVIEAMRLGKRGRRKTWGKGSVMYVDYRQQLMRTPNTKHANDSPANDYNWVLDWNDITATDWQLIGS